MFLFLIPSKALSVFRRCNNAKSAAYINYLEIVEGRCRRNYIERCGRKYIEKKTSKDRSLRNAAFKKANPVYLLSPLAKMQPRFWTKSMIILTMCLSKQSLKQLACKNRTSLYSLKKNLQNCIIFRI